MKCRVSPRVIIATLFRLSQLWDKVGSKARADEARDRLRSDYDHTEWAKQLKGAATGG